MNSIPRQFWHGVTWTYRKLFSLSDRNSCVVPDAVTRRQVLTTGVISVVSLLSGCSAPIGLGDSQPELGQITVENGDDTDHTIHVSVARGSELVYGSSHELKSVSPGGEDDFGSIDTVVLDDSAWEGTTGTWTVYTRVDDETSWAEHAVPTDGEPTCYAVRLAIEQDASVTSFTPPCESWPPALDT